MLIDRIGRGVAGALIGATVGVCRRGARCGRCRWSPQAAGSSAYLAALGTQAGEDFAGVEMLYLNPSPRLAAYALLRTMIYPWDSVALGSIVLALAAAGAVRAGRCAIAGRWPPSSLISVPYLVFHLLFQDMTFVRYALPLVPAVAFLAVCGLEVLARRAALPASGALAVWAVAMAAPVAGGVRRGAQPDRPRARRDGGGEPIGRRPALWRSIRHFSGRSRPRRFRFDAQLAVAAAARVARAGSLLARGAYRAGVVSRRPAPNRSRADRSAEPRAIGAISRGGFRRSPRSAACGPRRGVVSAAAAWLVCRGRVGADAGNGGHRAC